MVDCCCKSLHSLYLLLPLPQLVVGSHIGEVYDLKAFLSQCHVSPLHYQSLTLFVAIRPHSILFGLFLVLHNQDIYNREVSKFFFISLF